VVLENGRGEQIKNAARNGDGRRSSSYWRRRLAASAAPFMLRGEKFSRVRNRLGCTCTVEDINNKYLAKSHDYLKWALVLDDFFDFSMRSRDTRC
jgi:hypothetical protein